MWCCWGPTSAYESEAWLSVQNLVSGRIYVVELRFNFDITVTISFYDLIFFIPFQSALWGMWLFSTNWIAIHDRSKFSLLFIRIIKLRLMWLNWDRYAYRFFEFIDLLVSYSVTIKIEHEYFSIRPQNSRELLAGSSITLTLNRSSTF